MPRTYTIPPLPCRPHDGHKGTFGRILIVAGSPTMIGAPALAGTAAMRAGAGLVQVATDPAIVPHVLTIAPELIGLALHPTSDAELLSAAHAADVILIGPGMGLEPPSLRRLLALLEVPKPTVLDADALTLLARQPTWPTPPTSAPRIITPHPGEMQRVGKLFGHPDIATTPQARIALAQAAASHLKLTVVLKGAHTVVADKDNLYVNQVSTSALSKAGTGDVLAGLMAALLHVLPNPFEAASLAVHLHAQAGVLAGNRLGPRSTLARDILEALPPTLRAHPESPAADTQS